MPRSPHPVYILAGGRSRRFGSDKARALWRGTPLILRQASILHTGGYPLTVVASTQGQYQDIGLATIADDRPHRGPLGGIRSAMRHRGHGWLFVTSCDLIELDIRWLDRLEEARNTDPNASAVAFKDTAWQPFPALYHTRLLHDASGWDNASVRSLLDRAAPIPVPAPANPPIRQVNTPDELRQTQRRPAPDGASDDTEQRQTRTLSKNEHN